MPKSVFVPYQRVRHQWARRLDLPIFETPEEVKFYLTIHWAQCEHQKLNWTESTNVKDLEAYRRQQEAKSKD